MKGQFLKRNVIRWLCVVLLCVISLVSLTFYPAAAASENQAPVYQLSSYSTAAGENTAQPENKISGFLNTRISMKLAQQESPVLSLSAQVENLPEFETGSVLSERIFIYLKSAPTEAQLADLVSLGITPYPDYWVPPVGQHPLGFFLAEMPVDKLNLLASQDYVVRLDTAERELQAQNDLGAQQMNVDDVWNYGGTGYDGTGVTITVLDSGLDLTHPDIPLPTAVKDYSDPLHLDNDIANHVTGHGTHVSGSVLGRGTASGGVYKGTAPGANLVFLKIGNDTDGGATTAAVVFAIIHAVDIYHTDIITMSYGGWDEYHDGTSPEAQAVDYAVSRGTLVFMSAGNSAADADHYSGTVGANSASGFIQVNVSGAAENDTALDFNLVWFDGLGAHNQLSLEYYDAAYNPLSPIVYSDQTESSRGTESAISYYSAYLPAGSGKYYLKVKNDSLNSQFFHIYDNWGANIKFANPDKAYTLGSPSDADGAISVGAYGSRKTWWDYTNHKGLNSKLTVDEITYFSSRGPRIDSGAPVKPDITAPGSMIISAKDSNIYPILNPLDPDNWLVIDNDGPNVDDPLKNDGKGPAQYIAFQGTSMATPLAAGVAALLLQANPGLTPAQIKAIMQDSATDKGDPGSDTIYGSGLLNALAALQAVLPVVVSAATDAAGDNITLTFNKAMADPGGQVDRFSYTVDGGASQNFSAAALGPDPFTNLVLTPAGTDITNTGIVSVSYSAGTVSAADGSRLAGFSDLAVTNNLPGAAPAVISAATNAGGDNITLTFSKAMADPNGRQGQFSYSINGADAQTFSTAELGPAPFTTINLTASGTPIAIGNSLTLSYAAGDVAAADDGRLAGFNNLTVTNNMQAAPPVLVSSATSLAGDKITLTFNKAMSNPDGKHAQFSYKINAGIAQTVSAALLGPDPFTTISLTLSGRSVLYGDVVTLSYAAVSVTAADGALLAGFIDRSVTNTLPLPPPVVTAVNPVKGTMADHALALVLTGSGFLPGALVEINDNSTALITGSGVNVGSPARLTAIFDLSGVTTNLGGMWNVKVTNADNQSGTGSNLFHIYRPDPIVTAITPNSALNTGLVAITELAGANFIDNLTTVKLSKTGQADINATAVRVVSSTKITCAFDLTAKLAGDWNVVVTLAGAENSGSLGSGFILDSPSNVATVTSSTYTVSAAGTAAETITNVPYYTPKTTFLAALARGQFNQTWNDAGIANPVMPGNRLIVTAQDGATAVTYTVSVNAAPPVTGGGYYPPAAPAPVSTPVTTSGFNPAALMLNDKGLVKGDVLLVAKAQDITLLIPDGTRMLNAQGLPLTSLTAKPVTDVPYSPPSASVALMYDFGPNGSTFDPPLKLSIPFKAAEAGDALIAYWDGSRWIALATSFDTASAQLTAKISHFTLFGVIVANKAVVPPEPVKTPDNPGISVVVTPAKPGLPVLTPSITQDPVVTPAQTLVPLQTPVIPQTSLAPTPAAMEKNGGGFAWYWGLIIGIVVGLLAMWVLTWRRRSAQKNKG